MRVVEKFFIIFILIAITNEPLEVGLCGMYVFVN